MAARKRTTKARVSRPKSPKKPKAAASKPSAKKHDVRRGAAKASSRAANPARKGNTKPAAKKIVKKIPRRKAAARAKKRVAKKSAEPRPAVTPTAQVPGGPRADLRRRVLSEAVARSLRTVKDRVEAAKLHGPAMPEAPPAEAEVLPEHYGESFIVLLARDPWWLHSLWEVTPDRLGEAAAHFGDHWEQTRSVLRVYDVTAVDFDGANAHSFFDIELSGNASNWYIHAGTPNRSWVVDIGRVSPKGKFFPLARSNVAATPRDGMSDVLDEEWMEVDDFFEKMYALSGGLDAGRSSAELVSEMHRRLRAEVASGMVSSFGASALAKAEKVAGFWFTLDCELIVYGATEPEATVTMQGRPVRLRPDGTFTVRMALPDGLQEIETVATSPDGSEERTITPIVSRKTTSHEQALEPA